MHRSHLRLCGLAIVVALGYLVFTGGSASGVGLLIAALVCPLAMVLAMTVLMGRDQHHGGSSGTNAEASSQPVAPADRS
jgi:high-affinity Fe2+/Pb2+ permease